ncbi:MAG: UDP-N-acetylmuramate:L-alanyl-gamma-D-glutamyl-meso-diaminopimelate ligase [Pontibacterium sp.]
MHIHILGICGTFMGSLAVLAKQLGHKVTGSDKRVYPPMSTQLEAQGIELMEGYDPAHLSPEPDLVVIGNAMSRGNPAVEHVLDKGLNYTSGPQWLSDYLLRDKWVLAVAGTHGKTTTSTMLAWILEHAGMKPGFLIGGVPKNFEASARVGDSPFFVIEADEYDTAFFDKRSKFVHYHPRTLVLNNLEFDHADIFDDLAAIQRQFHHLIRIVPSTGQIIVPRAQPALDEVIEQGCWTEVARTAIEDGVLHPDSAQWQAKLIHDDGSAFEVYFEGQRAGEVRWSMTGMHSVNNGLVAIAAARNVGVMPHHAVEALCEFGGVKRRMEVIHQTPELTIYDDFAHHPTAIETTLAGLRNRVGSEKIIAIIEPRSNTMRMGVHQNTLAQSAELADAVIWSMPQDLNWSLDEAIAHDDRACVVDNNDAIISKALSLLEPKTHIVVMSNGGFGGLHNQLVAAVNSRNLS